MAWPNRVFCTVKPSSAPTDEACKMSAYHPIPAVRATMIEPLESTHSGHSLLLTLAFARA